jgi:hypothetical protein
MFHRRSVTEVTRQSVTDVLDVFGVISHNVPRVGDVAPSPTRARGHVAERRAAAPRSPRHPLRVPMCLRAVIRRCVNRGEWILYYLM